MHEHCCKVYFGTKPGTKDACAYCSPQQLTHHTLPCLCCSGLGDPGVSAGGARSCYCSSGAKPGRGSQGLAGPGSQALQPPSTGPGSRKRALLDLLDQVGVGAGGGGGLDRVAGGLSVDPAAACGPLGGGRRCTCTGNRARSGHGCVCVGPVHGVVREGHHAGGHGPQQLQHCVAHTTGSALEAAFSALFMLGGAAVAVLGCRWRMR